MSDPSQPISLCKVLEDEYEALHGTPPTPQMTDVDCKDDPSRLKAIYKAINQKNHVGLCFSGGGIRSATFCLGVLESFARHNLLDKFHYLSTVSGGGYIGSWLTSWIDREGRKNGNGLTTVIKALTDPPASPLEPEPVEVQHLRQYSNYLSPRLGTLSADGWTLVATFIRNLSLNWLVFIPLLMSVLMLPRICVAIIQRRPLGEVPPEGHYLMNGLLILGFVAGAMAICYIANNLPNLGAINNRQLKFIVFCLFPLGVSVSSLVTFIALFRMHRYKWEAALCQDWSSICTLPVWARYVGFGVGVIAGGLLFFALYSIVLQVLGRRSHKLHVVQLLIMSAAGIVGSVVAAVLAFLLGNRIFPLQPGSELQIQVFVCGAGPMLMLVYGIVGILIVGFTSNSGTSRENKDVTCDLEREWWARCGAWTLIVSVVWLVFSTVVLFGPLVLRDTATDKGITRLITVVTGIASGLTTLIGGFSGKTDAKKQGGDQGTSSAITSKLLSLAAIVFAVTIAAALSLLTDWVLVKVAEAAYWSSLKPDLYSEMANNYHKALSSPPLLLVIATCLGLAAFGVVLGFFVNTNIFSLHAVYRNRLIRAYLGASNDQRSPNLFTGFDPRDNLQMHKIWPGRDSKPREEKEKRLLHVLNITLNLVHGKELGWQQRKAESFTVTGLHCGNYRLGYRRSEEYGGDKGISIGTAVAVSGAAANPNMGYYSSPVVTFLMTLFNIRLGIWLGNPGTAGNGTYKLPAPRWPTRSLVAETLGETDDQHPYVNLSDGGHFENLGLYELARRRCRFIVVVDGGADGECTFDDLGNAIQKIRVDMGIEISFEGEIPIYSRNSDKTGGKRCAVATIGYSKVDPGSEDGILVYLKPVFYGNEPTDVYNYAMSNPTFPAESTADQWFSESQFESYRKLGLFTADQIIEGKQIANINSFVKLAYEQSKKEPPAWL